MSRNITKTQVVEQIVRNSHKSNLSSAQAFASSNIALCKYWGKKNEVINLPLNPSLSISLGELGTTTEVSWGEKEDQVWLNDELLPKKSKFNKRVVDFLDLFRPDPHSFFIVKTTNNIPTEAGLASSASGFAALTLALNQLFDWKFERKKLSILARLGSGSACRSLFDGFVMWYSGERPDGMDSFAEQLEATWPEFRIGVLTISTAKKIMDSRSAMKLTKETSSLYSGWPSKAKMDFNILQEAIANRDFTQLGRVSEANALAMHATMTTSWPPILYWLPESVAAMHRVWELRRSGVEVYLTMDAGPNVKLLFLEKDEAVLKEVFGSSFTVIRPFV